MEGAFILVGKALEYQIWARVTSTAEAVGWFITPFCLGGLTIWVSTFAYAIMRGEVHEPVQKFVWEATKKSFILTLALSSAVFQKEVVETFNLVSNGLMHAVSLGFSSKEKLLCDFNSSDKLGIYLALDCAQMEYLRAPIDIWRKVSEAGFFDSSIVENFLALIMISIMTLASTALFAFIGIEVIGIRITLMLVLALGPLFIASLAFEPFKKYFDGWISNISHIIVLQALTITMLGITLALSSDYLTGYKKAHEGWDYALIIANIFNETAGFVMLTAIFAFMFTRLPVIAGTLTGHQSNSALGSIAAVSQIIKMATKGFGGKSKPKAGGQITGG